MTRSHRPSDAQDSYDPFAHLEDPYGMYALVRGAPFYSEPSRSWIVTRWADIRWVLEHPDLFSARDTMSAPGLPPQRALNVLAQGYPPMPTVQNSDGADHRRLRTLVEGVLVPHFKTMRPLLRTQAEALMDTWIDARHTELMSQFAFPLALFAFFELLSIPQADWAQFRQWSDDFLAWVASLLSPTPLPEDRQIACATSLVAFQQYLGHLIARRRKTPGNDIISGLLNTALPNIAPLTEAELIAVLTDLTLGGYKTTASLIGTSVALLAQDAATWQELGEHPERIALALEEVLRFDSPVQAMLRTTTQKVTIPGTAVVLEEGARVLLMYGAANRDEAQFPQAEQFHSQRKPNRHLAFGHGIHQCVGAPLARLEGQVALEVLTRRLPHLRLKSTSQLEHVPTLFYRGYQALEVEW